jgi:nicotinamidase-related amidase
LRYCPIRTILIAAVSEVASIPAFQEKMAIDTLDPQRTALLFFDMLNGHIKKNDPATQARYQPVIAAAARLLQAARAQRMMIAYASANHRADNATTAHTIRDADFGMRAVDPNRQPVFKPIVAGGTWDAQVIDELAPAPEDYLIPKYRWSAFFQTYLDLALRTRKVDTIILSGGSTEIGVASTAYSARDLDYNLVIVSDACTSPAHDTHDHLMQHVFPRMAWVRTTAEVAAMLDPGAA